jgi:hypothetical protein
MNMQPRRQTIPVILQVKTALQILWQQRDDALRLGLIPTLLMFGGVLYAREALEIMRMLSRNGIPTEIPPGVAGPMLVMSFAWLISGCLMMVNWLRFLLLGPMGAVGVGLAIGVAHLRFLLAAIGMAVAIVVVMAILMQPVLLLVPGTLAGIGSMLIAVIMLVVIARFLPFLVGRAIGQSMSLAQSWRVSRGNGASLAASLILVQLPILFAFALLDFLLKMVGFVAVAPVAMVFLFCVAQILVSICQASVLANAYRHMVGVRV